MKGYSKRCACLIALLALKEAAANPAQNTGFGSRASAMAGAVSADVRDPAAVIYNPSGLSLGKGAELSLGYDALSYDLELARAASNLGSVHGMEAGLVARSAIAELPVAFGLTIDLPTGDLAEMRTFREGKPDWPLYRAPEIVELGAALSVRPFEFLAVGGGVGFVAATRAAFRAAGDALPQDGELKSSLDSIRYPKLGMTVMPSERIAFALTYRGSVELRHRLFGTFGREVGGAPYEFESTAGIGFVPSQFTLGTSLHPLGRLAVNLDLVWQDWSAYPSPVGSSSATPQTPAVEALHPAFEDRIVPRLGLESMLAVTARFSLAFRGGYAFEESPAARHQLASALMDADRHIASFGTGFEWEGPASWLPQTLSFDTHALFARLVERRMTVLADGVSRDISASGSVWSVGATLSLRFE